jgi:endogenous inhibitor of DNA gyrase (YacG/DUF329 family)
VQFLGAAHSNEIMATVKCPTCGTATEWAPANPFRPFCCERCKNIDLGAWATERYTIPALPPTASDTLEDAGFDRD